MREKEYLRQQYAAIFSSVGFILLLSAGVMILPLMLLLFYPEEMGNAHAFALPAACLGLTGLVLWKAFRPSVSVPLSVREGGIIVFISWILVILFSAWPFVPVLGLSFSRAFFESVSGWTTTGLSVADVTRAGHLILFWRSLMQFAGGAGLAIIMMSAIAGPAGAGISGAEGRSDQLLPHVRRSARLVLMIYFCYAVAGTLAYRLAGMSFFDAVNHSFAALSTGGFSTRAESIAYWNSPAVEAVTLPLMLLGNLSFVTAWFLWRGNFRTVARNGEIRLLSVLIPASAIAVFFFTCRTLYTGLGKSARAAVFETVSALTTTGFTSVTYGNWNAFGIFTLTVLMLIGGGTCSTAGGIKQFRVWLLWKLLVREIRRALLPRTAIVECPIWEGGRRVFLDDTRVREVTVFVSVFFAIYVPGVMLLCACGYSLPDSLFEFASAMGTAGLSVGVTSAGMPDTALYAEILAMFLGRLEFIVVIVTVFRLGRDSRLMMRWTLKGE